jgi:hypothetical protein
MDVYKLSRNWFDFCFENPELVKPVHTALYFFCIEHCNRLGWKQKFGLPTEMTKEAIGVKNYRTYAGAFEDLVLWGFLLLINKSKNQYSANVIAIAENTKANTKALSKATQKHSQKQRESTVCIDIPETLIPETIITYTPTQAEIDFQKFQKWITENALQVSKMREPFTISEFEKLKLDFDVGFIQHLLSVMHNYKPLLQKNINANLTFRNWAKRETHGKTIKPASKVTDLDGIVDAVYAAHGM